MTNPPYPRSGPSASARSAGAPPRTAAPPRRRAAATILAAAAAVLALALAGCDGDDEGGGEADAAPDRFDSDRAFELIEMQVEEGPRPAGSPASRELAEHLVTALPGGELEPVPGGLRNVVGVLPGSEPAILVGAHYDTEATIPGHVGANDGAAGTAAVIEVAQALERELPAEHREVRFVLFDGEEEPRGCPEDRFEQCALRGSKAYVRDHAGEVGELILLDYVANRGLRIPREANSDPELWAALRESAERVGASGYFPAEGDGEFAIIDDHIPFTEAGIPSIDLIDFTYEYADTPQDTPDKLDPEALDAVGETVTELVLGLASDTASP
jgi:glutaminyl-peptide cyclotransferase